jgi:hypothetical protein
MFERVTRHRSDEFLAEVHVAVQIAERHLRFDHPELGSVPRRIRVLSAERRTKGVNV